MNIKIIEVITATVLICQLIFSFYYSSLSVSLNHKYQSKYTEYQLIKNINDELKTDFTKNTSLAKLATDSAGLQPIKQVIDLGNP